MHVLKKTRIKRDNTKSLFAKGHLRQTKKEINNLYTFLVTITLGLVPGH
jgi:hypothetical protein